MAEVIYDLGHDRFAEDLADTRTINQSIANNIDRASTVDLLFGSQAKGSLSEQS